MRQIRNWKETIVITHEGILIILGTTVATLSAGDILFGETI